MNNRRQLLEVHDNDYGFDVTRVLAKEGILSEKLPMVSVVIPYYETGAIFERCLHFLYDAIANYPGKIEVIAVDDGSPTKPIQNYTSDYPGIHIISLQQNQGRTEARNTGLAAATGEIILFLDSDILVDDRLINNHIKLHLVSTGQRKKAICVSFFEFIDDTSPKIAQPYLKSADIVSNDFRLDCTYGATWIGEDGDKQYIGQHIRLVEETDNFKTWHGQYKAWMLPNMVLGGAFSVQKKEIDAIGGFDPRFVGYGFTETSAVTRMIAERNNVVVPCTVGGALHIEDPAVNVPQEEKDRIFKQKRDFYFNTFLLEDIT